MTQEQSSLRAPGVTYAVSDTGPLISAFQSESFVLLSALFAGVHIPPVCAAELTRHGWESHVLAASSKLAVVQLVPEEEEQARTIAGQIAQHPSTTVPVMDHHLGEAQAIVLARRAAYRDDLLLVDELAARALAKQLGVRLSGFPGVLLAAVQSGLISADDLKEGNRTEGQHTIVTTAV